MMADDLPSRITPGEITALFDHMRGITVQTPLAEQITYHERKARLLSKVAARLDTPEAYLTAADAWHQVTVLTRRRDAEEVT